MSLRSQLLPLVPFVGPLAAAWLASAALIATQLF
jgi:hypothetical protein